MSHGPHLRRLAVAIVTSTVALPGGLSQEESGQAPAASAAPVPAVAEDLRAPLRRLQRQLVHLSIQRADRGQDSDPAFASGWLLSTAGEVVTAAPALDSAQRVIVRFVAAPELLPRRARILGIDLESRVGVLSVGPIDAVGPEEPLDQVVAVAEVAEGLPVLTVGSQDSLRPFASLGQLRGKQVVAWREGGPSGELWEVSLMVRSAGQGCVVARPDGGLVGLVLSVGATPGTPAESMIGLAVPFEHVEAGVERVLERVRTDPPPEPVGTRPWLGVSCLDVVDPTLLYHLKIQGGIVVYDVLHGSPAHLAGLGRHDVIVGYDSHPVTSRNAFHAMVESSQPGDLVDLEVIQRGQRRHVSLVLSSW